MSLFLEEMRFLATLQVSSLAGVAGAAVTEETAEHLSYFWKNSINFVHNTSISMTSGMDLFVFVTAQTRFCPTTENFDGRFPLLHLSK